MTKEEKIECTTLSIAFGVWIATCTYLGYIGGVKVAEKVDKVVEKRKSKKGA